MKPYKHLTLSERKKIEEKLKKGEGIQKIAKALGRSPSTISREIRRNWSKKAKHYHAWAAQIKYGESRKRCHRKNNLLLDPEAYEFAYQGLQKYWSPEIIAKKWNMTHERKFSYNSVYRAIRAKQFPKVKEQTHLRRRGKLYSNHRKSYTRYFEPSIHDRPACVENRERLGDFEGDTMYGSIGRGYLVTAVDRRSRLLVAAVAKDKTIEEINRAFREAFARSAVPVRTLTLDNGTEFLGFRELEKDLKLHVYFADSHAPWQRGSNENVNGLLRFFFPRGTDFRKVSREELDYVLDLINNRPRLCLDLLSPLDFVALALTI